MNNHSILEYIPLLSVSAGPLENQWPERLKEELKALIKYASLLKESEQEWFYIKPQSDGIKWEGRCWYVHELRKYEFKLTFSIPNRYPITPIEIEIPDLEGKSSKMYHGGKICLDSHFNPLWSRNYPKYGIAHVLALGLAPWLAAEIPYLVIKNKI